MVASLIVGSVTRPQTRRMHSHAKGSSADGEDSGTSRRRAAAWALAATGVLCFIAANALRLATSATIGPDLADLRWGVLLSGFLGMGLLLALRRSQHPIGWLLLAVYALGGMNRVAQSALHLRNMVDPHWLDAYFLSDGFPLPPLLLLKAVLSDLVLVAGCLLLVLFPDGRLPPRRGLWLTTSGLVLGASALVFLALGARPYEVFDFELVGNGLFGYEVLLVGSAAATAAVGVRYRVGGPVERLQLRWLLAVFAVGAGGFTASIVTRVVAGELSVWTQSLPVLMLLTVVLIPIPIAIAVLRFRLYDIDVAINRTLVFVALVALVVTAFVGTSLLVASVVGGDDGPGWAGSVIASAGVVVLFRPADERVRRWAHRVAFGRWAEPEYVLAASSARLGQPLPPAQQAEAVASLLAAGTGAASVQIWRTADGRAELLAEHPATGRTAEVDLPHDGAPALPGMDLVVPVTNEDSLVGLVTVRKDRGNPLTDRDRALARDLAPQVGMLLRTWRLEGDLLDRIEQLRASRRRLARVQDDVRRRLERDIHDSAQHRLLAVKLRLGLLQALLHQHNTAGAQEVMGELLTGVDAAIDAVRRVARGIYPLTLSADGVGPALRSETESLPIPVDVVDETTRRYSQDVETTTYFCLLEAVQNAVKHAHASSISVVLRETPGDLIFSVDDDGNGFDVAAARARGDGVLVNLGDRLDAAGGILHVTSTPGRGTRLEGRIPLTAAARQPGS